MTVFERVGLHFKRNHTSAARQSLVLSTLLCVRLPLSALSLRGSHRATCVTSPIRPINRAILIRCKKIWLTEPQMWYGAGKLEHIQADQQRLENGT